MFVRDMLNQLAISLLRSVADLGKSALMSCDRETRPEFTTAVADELVPARCSPGIIVQMSAFAEAPIVLADDRPTWRAWLEENHATATGCWLVMWRAKSGHTPRLAYEDAIEEATCFGWVDSTAGKFDVDRGKLYFSPRRPRSPWAATNKARVAKLTAEGRMAPAGLAAVERAKANGYWEILDSSERLEVPDDLAAVLARYPSAADNFHRFPPSARKQMLGWVALARRPETRASRIEEIAVAAQQNERARG